jgi:hypothetical protein
MIPMNNEYPVFEANQILSAEHLNSMGRYLDEQNRLTTVALHGIGIVCGLDISIINKSGTIAVGISKGYGVTSQGYPAIVEDGGFLADRYRKFIVQDGYGLFLTAKNKNKYTLLELLDSTHENYEESEALTEQVLLNHVVLLFVERLESKLKNCTPTSCDDKGSKVTLRLRKLLISEKELGMLNADIAKAIEETHTSGDFFPDLTSRLNLPEIMLPRLDVPASGMVDAQSIFSAYRKVLPRSIKLSLFAKIAAALDAAYSAFKPILPPLSHIFFSDKLHTIEVQYNDSLTNTGVIYSQYYLDFLSDLIEAYDEFRWKALELMALCNPPEVLFPRHLELGETAADNLAGNKVHRHYFRPSPALACQKQLHSEVEQLFMRLRLMVEQFELPSASKSGTTENLVKITPSHHGDVALSRKAIPYYYTRSASLVNAWNFQTTRRGGGAQNYGYQVTSDRALYYDLEKYNFFRIEGHIGLEWRKVLEALLNKIRRYRLPFDVVALNAHPATASADVLADPLLSRCLTNDLEMSYTAWSKEFECLMQEKIKALTDFRFPWRTVVKQVAVEAAPLNLITHSSPKRAVSKINTLDAIVTTEGTFGKVFTSALEKTTDIKNLNAPQLKEAIKNELLSEVKDVSATGYDLAIDKRLDVVAAILNFSNAIPLKANDLQYTTLSDAYTHLTKTVERYRDELMVFDPSEARAVLTLAQKDDLIKTLKELLTNCLSKRLEELGAELERRKKKVDELIYFSKYAQQHPALEHKSGVPKGGTFVLIFQEIPAHTSVPETKSFISHTLDGQRRSDSSLVSEAGNQLKPTLFNVPERVVIADFFLPYRCCSDCPPVQFVLPAPRPIFVMKSECPDDHNLAQVKFVFSYCVPPCEVKIDNNEYVPLVDERMLLQVGKHQIVVRDAEGGISLPQEIEIFRHFKLEKGEPICDESKKTYTVKIKVTDGRLPMTIDGIKVDALPDSTNASVCYITTAPFTSGESVTVAVGDSSNCPAQQLTFNHTCCDLPCNGKAEERGYLFWLPPPNPEQKLTAYQARVVNFTFEYPKGKIIQLTEEEIIKINESLNAITVEDVNNHFDEVVLKWIEEINGLRGKSGLRFANEKSTKPGFFTTLRIEHFECLEFDITVVSTFRIGDRQEQIFDFGYNSQGTTIPGKVSHASTRLESQYFVPAFNTIKTYKCEPERKPEMPYDNYDCTIEILDERIENGLSVSFATAQADQVDTCLWEVLDGTLFLSNKIKYDFHFMDNQFQEIEIRLSVFMKNGCRIVTEARYSKNIQK